MSRLLGLDKIIDSHMDDVSINSTHKSVILRVLAFFRLNLPLKIIFTLFFRLLISFEDRFQF